MIKQLKVTKVLAKAESTLSKVDDFIGVNTHKPRVTNRTVINRQVIAGELDFLDTDNLNKSHTTNNPEMLVIEEMRNTILELQQTVHELLIDRDRVSEGTRCKLIDDMQATVREMTPADAANHAKRTYDLAFFREYNDLEFVQLFAQELLNSIKPRYHIPLWKKVAQGGMTRINEVYSEETDND